MKPNEIVTEIRSVREKGYAISDEELEKSWRWDSGPLAVPVAGSTGEIVAAVSVSASSARVRAIDLSKRFFNPAIVRQDACRGGERSKLISLVTMLAVVGDRMALAIDRLHPVPTNPLAFAVLAYDFGFRRLGHGVPFLQLSEVADNGQAAAPPLHRSMILGFQKACLFRDQDDKRARRFDSAGVFGGDVVGDGRLDPGLPGTIRAHARLPCLRSDRPRQHVDQNISRARRPMQNGRTAGEIVHNERRKKWLIRVKRSLERDKGDGCLCTHRVIGGKLGDDGGRLSVVRAIDDAGIGGIRNSYRDE
jgi:hypothetical protein